MENYPRNMLGYGQKPPHPLPSNLSSIMRKEEKTVSSTETLHPKHFFPKLSVRRPLSEHAI